MAGFDAPGMLAPGELPAALVDAAFPEPVVLDPGLYGAARIVLVDATIYQKAAE